jgi:hypothetical protein
MMTSSSATRIYARWLLDRDYLWLPFILYSQIAISVVPHFASKCGFLTKIITAELFCHHARIN